MINFALCYLNNYLVKHCDYLKDFCFEYFLNIIYYYHIIYYLIQVRFYKGLAAIYFILYFNTKLGFREIYQCNYLLNCNFLSSVILNTNLSYYYYFMQALVLESMILVKNFHLWTGLIKVCSGSQRIYYYLSLNICMLDFKNIFLNKIK